VQTCTNTFTFVIVALVLPLPLGVRSVCNSCVSCWQKHSAEIINIGIASNGKFIMTCYADTTLKIWDLKGDCLSKDDEVVSSAVTLVGQHVKIL